MCWSTHGYTQQVPSLHSINVLKCLHLFFFVQNLSLFLRKNITFTLTILTDRHKLILIVLVYIVTVISDTSRSPPLQGLAQPNLYVSQGLSAPWNSDLIIVFILNFKGGGLILFSRGHKPGATWWLFLVLFTLSYFDGWPTSNMWHQKVHEYILAVLRLLHCLV